MAWFHKTLMDMEAAIKRGNWEEAKAILNKHTPRVHGVDGSIQLDLADLSTTISDYSHCLGQIRVGLDNIERGSVGAKTGLEVNVRTAIECAHKFEEVLMRLQVEGKFLE